MIARHVAPMPQGRAQSAFNLFFQTFQQRVRVQKAKDVVEIGKDNDQADDQQSKGQMQLKDGDEIFLKRIDHPKARQIGKDDEREHRRIDPILDEEFQKFERVQIGGERDGDGDDRERNRQNLIEAAIGRIRQEASLVVIEVAQSAEEIAPAVDV